MLPSQCLQLAIAETIDALTLARSARDARRGSRGPDAGVSMPALAFTIVNSVEAGPGDSARQRAEYVFALQALDAAYREAGLERPEGLARQEISAEIARAQALPITPRPRPGPIPTLDERCGYVSTRGWPGELTYGWRAA